MTGPNKNSVTETMQKGGSVKKYQQGGGGAGPIAPTAPTVRSMKNDPKKCIGSPPGYVWNERLGGCMAPPRSKPASGPMMKKGGSVKHPGFKAVASKIASKQGVSKNAASAILAASTRKASAKAKIANPRLKKVK